MSFPELSPQSQFRPNPRLLFLLLVSARLLHPIFSDCFATRLCPLYPSSALLLLRTDKTAEGGSTED